MTTQKAKYTQHYEQEIQDGMMPEWEQLSPEEQGSVCERCGVILDPETPINDGEAVLCGDCDTSPFESSPVKLNLPLGSVAKFFADKLGSSGLFEDQVDIVMAQVMGDKKNPFYGRWLDQCDVYPQPMLSVLWVEVRLKTIEWARKHKPQAWWIPVFEGG